MPLIGSGTATPPKSGALRTRYGATSSCWTRLPRATRLALLRDLRTDRTPVLIATARDAVSDRIAGLDAGG